MQGWLFALGSLAVLAGLFFAGRARALATVGGNTSGLHSTPGYHGFYLVIWAALPAVVLFVTWGLISRFVTDAYVAGQLGDAFAAIPEAQRGAFLRAARSLVAGAAFGEVTDLTRQGADAYRTFAEVTGTIVNAFALLLAVSGLGWGWTRIAPRLRARQFVERTVMWLLIAASGVAIITTIGIVLSLIFESLQFFARVNFFDFLFGLHWSPQSAYESITWEATDRNSEVFGAIPVFVGTLLITTIAIAVAAPVGLMSAIYLSDYASKATRAFAKPILEILAGIPTVVYGFFAALTVAPFFRSSGESFGLTVSSESALAAGMVMGIMIIPFVSSLSDDVINAVPQSLRDGSAGLGATKSETIRKVVLPAALPGIVSALMLAISRAIGETMIVVMAAGLAANMTINPLEAVTTVTVQIVTLLTGDSEFDSAKTLSAFALGLMLFCVTLLLNVIALRVIQKYREQYD